MFTESGLILTLPGPSRRSPGRSEDPVSAPPKVSAATRAEVETLVASVVGPGKYTFEPMRNGLRLVHTSRSSQARRRDAEQLLPHHRDTFRSRFNLSLQLDRPFAQRQFVKVAYEFLEGVKKACPSVSKIGVSKGMCYLNSLPIGPIWLVPRRKTAWPPLYDMIIRDFANMPKAAADIANDGYFAPLLAHAFVFDSGLRQISEVAAD